MSLQITSHYGSQKAKVSSLEAIPPASIAEAKLAIDMVIADFHPNSLTKVAKVAIQGR